MLPCQFNPGPAPNLTLLLLHGTGGTARDLLPIGRFLVPTAPQLALSGENGHGATARFFDPGDPAAAVRQGAWLLATLHTLAQRYQLDEATVVPVGYSNGASLALAATLTQPVPWRRAVLLHPVALTAVPSRPLPSPPHLWASFGTADPHVSAAEFQTLTDQIRSAGGALTVFTHPGGHQLGMPELRAVRAWLQSNPAE